MVWEELCRRCRQLIQTILMSTGKYKSSELYGRPSDPELIKQRREYIRNKTGRDGPEPRAAAKKPRP